MPAPISTVERLHQLLFNPSARLDASQVEDMRMPTPMDTVMRGGHPVEWYDSPNAGGISWNPMMYTTDPGPMNTGHRTYPEQPLPGDAKYQGREGGRKPGQGTVDPEAKDMPQAPPKRIPNKLKKSGLKTYGNQVKK